MEFLLEMEVWGKMTKIQEIFDSVNQNNVFREKSMLQINYKPENIPHRDPQITQIASILAPVLKGDRPSNLFLYGKTGTGKTFLLVLREFYTQYPQLS